MLVCVNVINRVIVVVSNGWLWLYAISLLASQFSCTMFFVLSGLSTGHCSRWASFIMESSCWHMVQLAEGRILILCRWATRQSWPVANQKVTMACLPSLFLFWSHNSLIPFHFFPFIICCVFQKFIFCFLLYYSFFMDSKYLTPEGNKEILFQGFRTS